MMWKETVAMAVKKALFFLNLVSSFQYHRKKKQLKYVIRAASTVRVIISSEERTPQNERIKRSRVPRK